MNEYKKKLAAMQAGQQNNESAQDAPEMTNGIPNSALVSVFEGRSKATSQMMGHRVNLAESINAKMQQAFGMDISGLRIYRSEAMKGTGMHGMAQGNTIVLGSDVNLNTTEGQAVLGHEISHIHAQRQGVGMGRGGLYRNAGLEHQADVEGMRAARGRPIYSNGMEFSDGMKYGLGMKGVDGIGPMSEGLGPVAAAPMQAKKDKDAPKERSKKAILNSKEGKKAYNDKMSQVAKEEGMMFHSQEDFDNWNEKHADDKEIWKEEIYKKFHEQDLKKIQEYNEKKANEKAQKEQEEAAKKHEQEEKKKEIQYKKSDAGKSDLKYANILSRLAQGEQKKLVGGRGWESWSHDNQDYFKALDGYSEDDEKFGPLVKRMKALFS